MRAVFVPGSGLDGANAWRHQSPSHLRGSVEATYLTHRDLESTRHGQVEVILRALGTEGGHLVAHSIGGAAATRAAELHPERLHSLTLFEPAAFGLARGSTEVERHIEQMGPIFELADDTTLSDAGFWMMFLQALGAPAPDPSSPGLDGLGRRLRSAPPPWEPNVDPGFVALVPTTVITGGWSPLYEEVAGVLAGAGATHVVLEGNFHRPQDHEGAGAVLRENWQEPG